MHTCMNQMVHANSQLIPTMPTIYQVAEKNHTTKHLSESKGDVITKEDISNQAGIYL